MSDTRIEIEHAHEACAYQERETGAWIVCPVCEDNTPETFARDYVVVERDYEADFDMVPDDWDYNPW